MKKITLLLAAVLFTSVLAAQRRVQFSVGAEFSIPVHSVFDRSPGLGLSVGMDARPEKKWAFVAELGYNYFAGPIIKTNPPIKTSFGMMPAVAGVRIKSPKGFYGAVRGGLGIRIGFGGGTLPVFSPAAGWEWRNKNKKPVLDLGARWIRVVGMPSYPENSVLEKGGYSYFNIRIARPF